MRTDAELAEDFRKAATNPALLLFATEEELRHVAAVLRERTQRDREIADLRSRLGVEEHYSEARTGTVLP